MTSSDLPLDLNAVLVFAAVAEAGGFTAAAERLGLSKARVSLEVSRLEARLGTSLFTRTTRRVLLTEAGQTLLAEGVPALRQAQDLLHGLGQPGRLQGSLRIACTVEHASQSVAAAVAAFAEQHPDLQVELRSSDRVVDLVREGVDVAIRMGWLRDSSLRAVRLGGFGQRVVAAPAYLARHPRPEQPEDLAGLDWVGLTLLPSPWTWRFSRTKGGNDEVRTVRMNGRLRCDSAGTLRALLCAGAGVSAMDSPSTEALLRQGELIELLPEWTLPSGGIHAVCAPGRHIAPKVRAFIDFYAAWLQGGAAGGRWVG